MKRAIVIAVDLERYVDEDDPTDTGWFAEWDVQGDSSGVEDSQETLRELVDAIVDDVRSWTDRYEVTLEWKIGGDAPEGSTVEDEIRRLEVTLPSRVEPA